MRRFYAHMAWRQAFLLPAKIWVISLVPASTARLRLLHTGKRSPAFTQAIRHVQNSWYYRTAPVTLVDKIGASKRQMFASRRSNRYYHSTGRFSKMRITTYSYFLPIIYRASSHDYIGGVPRTDCRFKIALHFCALGEQPVILL